MSKQRILVITNTYYPIINSASMLMGDLVNSLKSRGNDVYVLTKYPVGFDKGYKIQEQTVEEGVNIVRVKVPPVNMVNYIRRGINTLLYPWLLYFKSKKYLEGIDFDAIILYAPPIQLARTVSLYKRNNNAQTILILRDLFPQNAVDLGILKNRLLIKYFESVESRAYKTFDFIAPQLYENKEHLIKRKNVSRNKIDVIYNWLDVKAFDETIKENIDYKQKYDLKDKTVCLFGGTIGPAQGVDFILDIAIKMKNMDNICFLIIGDGTEKKKLVKKAADMKLNNVIFKEFITNNEFNMLTKSCDIGLINLSRKNKTSIIPGKILSFMAASVPIMGAVNSESVEVKEIINNNKCGYLVDDGDIEGYIARLKELINDADLRKTMGNNGRKYLIDNFSVEYANDKIDSFLEKSID